MNVLDVLDAETRIFLGDVLPRHVESERAVHNGDVSQRLAFWSKNAPVTVLGAWRNACGWAEVGPLFEALGDGFRDCTACDHEVIAARAVGDLAYLVAFEHTNASFHGVPKSYTLRVTTVFVREDGQWKAVHRHADELAGDLGLMATSDA
jgi:ketosteroid isomerase-like protein